MSLCKENMLLQYVISFAVFLVLYFGFNIKHWFLFIGAFTVMLIIFLIRYVALFFSTYSNQHRDKAKKYTTYLVLFTLLLAVFGAWSAYVNL